MMRWYPGLNTRGAGFARGMNDAAETSYAPDRYKHPLAQQEYEAGWAFARWCFRTGHVPRNSTDVERLWWTRAVKEI